MCIRDSDKPVNIMDLGKIAAVARNLLESGLEEETAIGYTAAYVTTIQVA